MTENISTETQTSPTAEYEPLKVDFTPTPAVVPLVAWTWNTPVIPQFYWNVYSAEQRIKQICLEIGRIQEYLNYFAAHYNKMSGYLNKRIDKLTAAMYAEVERLDKAIEEENKARKLADELLQKGLDAEIARAKAAEVVLQQNIDTNTTLIEDEEKRAKDAEEKLTTALHDETAARIAEDKKITDTVETNRQHAEEIDAQLFDSIRTEANLRKNADNLLSDRIDKETEERKANDVSINTRIDNEHADRVKADNELDKRVTDNAQAIEHETERAKSAETNLNDALEREIDARVDTDRSLENSIDTNDRASKDRDNKLQGNIDANDNASKDRDKQLQANIDAEITNRGNAENAINDRITNEVNDRKADDASINTHIDKETEERKNDVTNLNTRVDTEQTERVKADNELDKRVTNNQQAVEHETERAKSAETNLNDALEREVDARQDDTRKLENQIDKTNNDVKNNYDDLTEKITQNKEQIQNNLSALTKDISDVNENADKERQKLADNLSNQVLNVSNELEYTKQRISNLDKDISITNSLAYQKVSYDEIQPKNDSHITINVENKENGKNVIIGDTFEADFNKVNNDIEVEKQRAIAKENELSGKVEHETQERQTETNAINAEVSKRPTLDKFIAGENITLTPDVDKTTLTISAKNTGLTEEEKSNIDKISKSVTAINMNLDARAYNAIKNYTNIKGDDYITTSKEDVNNITTFNVKFNKEKLSNKILENKELTEEERFYFNEKIKASEGYNTLAAKTGEQFISKYLQAGNNITFTKPSTGESKLIINANLDNYKIDSHNNSIGVVEYEDKSGFDLVVNPRNIIKTTRFIVNEGNTMPTYAKHITVKSTNILSVMPFIEFTDFSPIANDFSYYCMLDEESKSTLIFYKESANFTKIKKYEIVVVYLVTE